MTEPAEEKVSTTETLPENSDVPQVPVGEIKPETDTQTVTETEPESVVDSSGLTSDYTRLLKENETLKARLDEKERELERLRDLLIEQEEEHTQTITEFEDKLEAAENSKKELDQMRVDAAALSARCAEWQNYAQEQEANALRLQEALDSVSAVAEALQANLDASVAGATQPLKERISELEAMAEAGETAKKKLEAAERREETQKMMLTQMSGELAERRKTESELRAEVAPLKAAIAEMEQQIRAAEEEGKESVDKRIVTKMLLTYIARPSQRHETLELMSRILSFTDEDKEVCGLTSRHLLPLSPSKRLQGVEEKSLSQMWVEYLTTQPEGDQSGSVRSPTPNHRLSSDSFRTNSPLVDSERTGSPVAPSTPLRRGKPKPKSKYGGLTESQDVFM